jgi:hypothetical protein
VQERQHSYRSHPVKVGVWCAVSVRRFVVCAFFNETVNCERYLCVEGHHFQHLLRSVTKVRTSLHSKSYQHAESLTKSTGGGALVAVKRQAMNTSSLLKNTMYLLI